MRNFNSFFVLLFIYNFLFLNNVSFSKTLELVTLQYPPYEYQENGKNKGIVVEIINEVFKRMDQPINITLYPWARALNMVKTGKADAIFTAFKNNEREVFADYSKEVLMPQTISLFSLKNKNIMFNGNLESIKDLSIGVVHKVSYGKLFDEARKSKIISRPVTSYTGEKNLKRLLNNDLDLLISNTYGGVDILCKLGKLDEVNILTPPIESIPSYIAFSKLKKLTDIRDKFDIILAKMKKDGSYDKILKTYKNCLSK